MRASVELFPTRGAPRVTQLLERGVPCDVLNKRSKSRPGPLWEHFNCGTWEEAIRVENACNSPRFRSRYLSAGNGEPDEKGFINN